MVIKNYTDMKTGLNLLLIKLLLLIFFNAAGQDERSFTLMTDQDFFYFLPSKNEDRNYTQGTSLTFSDDQLYNTVLFAAFKGYNSLRAKIVKKRSVNPVMSSISIMGTAFTPRIIDSINPIIGDRPFAFLLGASLNQVSRIGDKFGHGSSYEALTLNIGLIGTDVGYDFQSFAHTHIVRGRPADPVGWNTQISRGGKFTLLVNYERMLFFSLNASKLNGWGVDGSVNIGGSLGYYDRIYLGAYLRFGWINQLNMPNWAFFGNCLASANKNSVPVELSESAPKPGRKRRYEGMELFGFTRFTNNLMFRNSLLVGQRYVKDDIYTLESGWANMYVFDFEFGVACGVYWIKNPDDDAKHKFVRILYKNTMRSPEFDSGIFPRRYHYFGSIGLQFSI